MKEPRVSVMRTSTDFCPVNFIAANVFLGVNQQSWSLNEISQRDSYTWCPGNGRGRPQPRARPHAPPAASSFTESHCLGWTPGRPRLPLHSSLEDTFVPPRTCMQLSVCQEGWAKRGEGRGGPDTHNDMDISIISDEPDIRGKDRRSSSQPVGRIHVDSLQNCSILYFIS